MGAQELNADRINEFMRLFTEHQRHVYYYIRTLCCQPADAEEVLSRTNLVLWEKFGQFQPGTNFRAWACQIARYEVFHFRSQRRGEVPFSDGLLENLADEAERGSDHFDSVREALAFCRGLLSSSHRELIDQRYRPGATSQSVAERLGRPVHSVYKSLCRIRKQLHDCIMRRLRVETQP